MYGGDRMIAFITVAFRECLEMFLVIGALLAYLSKVNRRDLNKYIYSGSVLGTVVSLILGSILFTTARSLEGYGAEIFEGSMMLFASGLIAYSLYLFGKQNFTSNSSIEERYNFTTTAISLFLLTFLTVFRESLEIIVFTLPFFREDILSIIIGLSVGVLIAFIPIYILYETSYKLNVNIIFNILMLILIFIGAMMFGEGLASFIPDAGDNLKTAGMMVFGIPALYLFLKKETKKHIKKK